MREQKRSLFNWFFWFQWIMVTAVGWVLGTVLLPPIDLAVSGIVIGALQGLILQHQIGRNRHWVVASALGWAAGWALTLVAVPAGFGLLAGIVLGAAVGIAQWLVLRREVQWAGWWIIISTLAWATGLGITPGFLMSGVMAGSLTGFALDLLLNFPRAPRTAEPEAT
ncbi:MAG: hypothetical protein JXA93_17335 [Anaerolineae bacterium]|nr:hypothetical protein [Anaerolineae bacterium]